MRLSRPRISGNDWNVIIGFLPPRRHRFNCLGEEGAKVAELLHFVVHSKIILQIYCLVNNHFPKSPSKYYYYEPKLETVPVCIGIHSSTPSRIAYQSSFRPCLPMLDCISRHSLFVQDVQRFMSLFLFAVPMRCWTWVPSGKTIRVFALHPTLLGDHITRSLGQQRNNCPWSSNIDNFHAALVLVPWKKVSSPSSANPRSTSSTSLHHHGHHVALSMQPSIGYGCGPRPKETRDELPVTLIALITSTESVKKGPSEASDCQKRSAARNSFDTNRGHNNAVQIFVADAVAR